jgi:ABC-type bacteriocin/lantibiotic exporter with double-glycine peptidase domain
MNIELSPKRRRILVSEVVQTSNMDCGPASLKCLLEGFGVPVSYGRLREACHTSVDGASIDTIEDVAVQLGLEAEQVMLSPEHLFYPEARALPSIVVVRSGRQFTHFVVAWRYNLGLVQVMDPSVGRRWMTLRQFRDWLYIHTLPVLADEWRRWAGSQEFLGCVRRSLTDLQLPTRTVTRMVDTALADEDWRSLAGLQAAACMVGSIACSGRTEGGTQTARLFESLFERIRSTESILDGLVPATYWPVLPIPETKCGRQQLLLRGAVLVRAQRLRAVYRRLKEPGAGKEDYLTEKSGIDYENATDRSASQDGSKDLPPELVAALEEPPSRPALELFKMVRADGFLTPAILVKALFVSTCAVVGTAVLFRGLLDIGRDVVVGKQRLVAFGLLLLFLTLQFVQGLLLASGFLRLGRHLEIRLRAAFLEKLPRLADRYFRSRLMSDMAERCHSIHLLRVLPYVAQSLIQNVFQLVLTAAGVIWLARSSTPIVLLVIAVAAGSTLAIQPLLVERDLRIRNHAGALTRFYLDALLGLMPVRAHGAERAVRRTHEQILVHWAHACFSLQRAAIGLGAIQFVIGTVLAVWLLCRVVLPTDAGSSLLLIYWALSLPALGQALAASALQYPICRNIMLRLLEPLSAPEQLDLSQDNPGGNQRADTNISVTAQVATNVERAERGGVAIAMEGVSLAISGHTILNTFDLRIEPGSHVAIVGPSGAGKSSLVGLLLGWYFPSSGKILIDGLPFTTERLRWLRENTAWVDPSVQVWNRSLIDNLNYGGAPNSIGSLGHVIEAAELRTLLETLPDGLQTRLGEGGALVSGGEGQRIRLGRAMHRRNARLVILDEPFTGLDRPKRERLLLRTRELWAHATVLYITHSIDEAAAFERVLVLDAASIIEDGAPSELLKHQDSHYQRMREFELALNNRFMSSERWRRLRVEGRQLVEIGRNQGTAPTLEQTWFNKGKPLLVKDV